jgi:hypothetical protein
MESEAQLALMAASIYPAHYSRTSAQFGATGHAEDLAISRSITTAREILVRIRRPEIPSAR